jgi:uncharacterized protein
MELLWERMDGPGLEHLSWDETRADGMVIAPGPIRVYYRITVDDGWRTRSIDVNGVTLHGDGDGHWRDAAGKSLPQLEGCVDVDVSVTPFTNTLPIRRLGLEIGEGAEMLAVYFKLPENEVSSMRQRYTRLSEDVYRYQSEGFQADLLVDEHGLVIDYPGFWRRVQQRT